MHGFSAWILHGHFDPGVSCNLLAVGEVSNATVRSYKARFCYVCLVVIELALAMKGSSWELSNLLCLEAAMEQEVTFSDRIVHRRKVLSTFITIFSVSQMEETAARPPSGTRKIKKTPWSRS